MFVNCIYLSISGSCHNFFIANLKICHLQECICYIIIW